MTTQPEVLQIEVAPVAVLPSSTRSKITPEQIEEIRALATQFSQTEIARRLGVTPPAISQIYKRENISKRDTRGANTPPELVEKIRALSLHFSQTEVAKKTGLSRSWLSRISKQFGIPALRLRKPPKPEPPVAKVCVIKITAAMRLCANKRGIEVGAYFVQLFESDLAEERMKKICASAKPEIEQPIFKEKYAPIKQEKSNKIDAAKVQSVLHLLSEDSLSVPEIAKRCGMSITSVRRIRDNFRASETRVPGAQRRNREKSWSWKEGKRAESSEASACAE